MYLKHLFCFFTLCEDNKWGYACFVFLTVFLTVFFFYSFIVLSCMFLVFLFYFSFYAWCLQFYFLSSHQIVKVLTVIYRWLICLLLIFLIYFLRIPSVLSICMYYLPLTSVLPWRFMIGIALLNTCLEMCFVRSIIKTPLHNTSCKCLKVCSN